MRADMFKIIIERPRWGSRHAAAAKLKRSRDPERKFIGHKRHAWIDAPYTKSLSDNLAPLVRFLRSRRGRLWDEVFSEICERIDTGSTVKMHIREHIDELVLSRVSIGRHGEWMWEGQVLGRGRYFMRDRFFVDPGDGILKDASELMASLPEANRIAKEGGR